MDTQDMLRQECDALKEQLRHYEIILAQTENVLFDWDYVADTISVSDTWKSIFGIPAVSGGDFARRDRPCVFVARVAWLQANTIRLQRHRQNLFIFSRLSFVYPQPPSSLGAY